MRYFIIFTLNLFFISKCFSLEIEFTNIYGKTNKEINLRILSSTDIEVFSPILNKFSQLNRNIAIEYLVGLLLIFMMKLNNRNSKFDLIVSSAMDLQIKLANDGYAKSIQISNQETMPNWSCGRTKLLVFH